MAYLTWAAALVLLGLCSGVGCFDYELTVEQGQTVCFQDYITGNNTITFGFSAFNVSSLQEMLESVYTGYPPSAQEAPMQAQADSGSHRRILGQKKAKQAEAASSPKKKSSRKEEPASDFEEGLEEEVLPEDFEAENGVKFNESAVMKGSKKKKTGKSGPIEKNLGKMWVRNQNNELLSPAAMKPFHLYKHRFEAAFSVVDICYQSLVEYPHLVRLMYTVHSLVPKESVVPSKSEADVMLQKITRVEETFAKFLAHFEQLEKFQRDFVSNSNATLKTFMFFGQAVLFCYLLLGYLMKLAVEKTLKNKKII